jgi:hypothetical protein
VSFGLFGSLLLLTFAGGIEQPIYQALVVTENYLIPTCKDTSYIARFPREPDCKSGRLEPAVVGWDVDPWVLVGNVQLNLLEKITSDLIDTSYDDAQPYLWSGVHDPQSGLLKLGDLNNESFVAALERGTTTGVLRERIMRFNSSVDCAYIPRSDFPSSCSGKEPFITSFSYGNNSAHVCVPGNLSLSPWTLSRDRQDITEELFLDVSLDSVFPFTKSRVDVTLHCTAFTTRGYFEVGNYRNNHAWGPVLDTGPSRDETQTNFNDILYYKDDDDSVYQEM